MEMILWKYTIDCFNSSVLSEIVRDFKSSTSFSDFSPKAFPKGEYVNLGCTIIQL